MEAQAVKYHRVHFRKSPDPTITLRVDPPVIACVGGRIPPNTKVYADFRVNGVLRKPDSLGPLFGSTSGSVPDTEEYESVRWLWNPSDPRFGFTIQRGTILKDITRSFSATLDGIEYTATLQLAHIEQAAVGYELFSPDCEVRFGPDGSPNRESVGVTPYRLLGNVREPLPVNDDAGAEHCVIFRRNGHTGMFATSRAASALGSCSWARFDLVRGEDVEMIPVGGAQTVGGYPDSAILASCPVILTHDGTDGSSAAFTSIVFFRSGTQPAKPSGGTYDDPIPTTPAGWSDAPPAGTEPLWLSRARFLPDTDSPDWSTPSSVQDSTAIEYIFSKAANPGTPANTHPFVATSVWTKDPADAVWMAIAVKNNGVWDSWKVLRVKGEKGDKGDGGLPGPQIPPMMLWSDYPSGYEFQDGVAALDGSPASRLDCALMENTASDTKDRFPLCYYRCIKPHIKADDKKPKDKSEYWERALEYSTVASQVILGLNGHIRLLATNVLRVYKSDGSTVNAAFGGGDWPAWFGAATPSDAPTKISADGTIHSTKAVIEGDVVFGGRVKPMVTRITSSNYTKYRARWNDVFNDDSSDNIWILDFRTLSGSVILDSTLSSVASSQLSLYMTVACQYQTASDTAKLGSPEEYIGSRMRIENNTSEAFSITGLITTDRSSLASGQSPSLQPGQEIDLECFVKAAYGRRAIGWYVEYHGPKG